MEQEKPTLVAQIARLRPKNSCKTLVLRKVVSWLVHSPSLRHTPLTLVLSANGCLCSSYHNPTSSLFCLGCQEAKPSSLLPWRPLCFLPGAPEVAYSAQHRPGGGPCPAEGEQGDLHLSRPSPTPPHFLEAGTGVLPVYESGEDALWLST